MKKFIKNLFLLAELSLVVGTRLTTAQTFTTTYTTLHSFSGSSDGASPQAVPILSGDTLYGTAEGGGSFGHGTVFAVRTNGTIFTVLHSFTGGSDGDDPIAGLILSGNVLYGTATGRGSSSYGTVFAVNTDGTSFTNLHNFTRGSDGAIPYARLILSGNTLYGTASFGGTGDVGTVFALNTNGMGFSTLHSFDEEGPCEDGHCGLPSAGLILESNILYGTTDSNVDAHSGTVFAINTNGTGFTTLHTFSGSDGASPFAGLILSGRTFYGTTIYGGTTGNGTLFTLNTDGTGFKTLHSFSASAVSPIINSDGANPYGGLILLSNTLYGTAVGGGIFGNGTVFSVNTDGTGFKTIYNFPGGTNGANPNAGLILSSNTLYGTTIEGGTSGQGTLFSLTMTPASAPQITSQPLNRTNIAGTAASFSVLVTGTAPLSYQWFKDARPLSLQSNFTLTLSKVSNADAATYVVVVTNIAGSVTSSPAILTVIAQPRLALNTSAAHVVLTWSTNSAGFTLQSTTNLRSSAIWTTVSAVPVVVNGQNVLSNPVSGTQKFYRLRH